MQSSEYIFLLPSQISYGCISMDVSSPTGLANHAETVCDYLYNYGGGDGTQRNEYSKKFFKYLLSACWEKVYRRFSSWQALSLIRKFQDRVDLLKGHLSLIGTSASSNDNFARGPGDRSLIQFLHWNKVVFGMLEQVLPDDPKSVFEKLRDEVIDHAFADSSMPLYTKETALAFHYLVFGAFLLAAQAIVKIKDGRRPLNQSNAQKKNEYVSQVDHFKKCIAAAVLPMKLLQCVLSSTAFKQHIGVWTSNGESVSELFPIWSQKSLDVKFGIDRQILSTLKQGPSKSTLKQGPSKESHIDDDALKQGLPKESHIDDDALNQGPSKKSHIDDDALKQGPSKESHIDEDDHDDCDDNLPEVSKFIC